MKIIHLLVMITCVIQIHGYWEVERLPNNLNEWGIIAALGIYTLVTVVRAFNSKSNDNIEQGT